MPLTILTPAVSLPNAGELTNSTDTRWRGGLQSVDHRDSTLRKYQGTNDQTSRQIDNANETTYFFSSTASTAGKSYL